MAKKIKAQMTRVVVKKPKTKKKQNGRPAMDELSMRYARLLLDPCNAELTYPPSMGSSETGYLVRLYRRYILHGTNTNNSGTFLWLPGFHSNDEDGFNVATWETSNANLQPLNTVANPWGSGGGVTAEGQPDPAGTWVASGSVSSARTVAACVRVYYTGNLSLSSGSVGVIPNMTADQMVDGGAGAPMSVNQALTMAPVVARIPLEAREIRWAPATGDLTYKARARSGTASTNAPFAPGVAGTSITHVTPVSNGTNGIGIAWSGLPATTVNDLVIECVKVLEWLPDATGLSQPNNNPRPKSTADTILTYLDDTLKGWRDTFSHSMAQNVIGTAQAGIGLYGSYIGLQRNMQRLRM